MSISEYVIDSQSMQKIKRYVQAIPSFRWDTYKIHEEFGNQDISWIGCYDIPESLRKRLIDIAPKFPEEVIDRIVIHKLMPGDEIPIHQDPSYITKIGILTLQSNGDGIIFGNEFYQDIDGVLRVYTDSTIFHYVPKVKEVRYSIVYGYMKDENMGKKSSVY